MRWMFSGVRDRRPLLAVGLVVALGLLLLFAGLLWPPREGVVLTDRLGPEQGELVADYVDRARRTFDDSAALDPRFALVSLRAAIAPFQALAVADRVRVSQVLYQVPIPRVQTTLVAVSVPDGSWALLHSAGIAARQLNAGATRSTGQPQRPLGDERRRRIDIVSAARLEDGCACIVGLTVRGTSAQLAELAKRNGVRSVEALPPDAVFGRFSVAPLLPEQIDVVAPEPDDGEVPDR